jgi:amino acid transporter
MIPASASAYTYTYVVLGELLAWVIGWSLILEYSLVVSAVAVGWSGCLAAADLLVPFSRMADPCPGDRGRFATERFTSPALSQLRRSSSSPSSPAS